MSELSILKGKLTKLQKKYDILLKEKENQKGWLEAMYVHRANLISELEETKAELRKKDSDLLGLRNLTEILKSEKDKIEFSLDLMTKHRDSRQRQLDDYIKKTGHIFKENELLKSRNLIQRILNVKYEI